MLMSASQQKRVLSIQSHVASGYVGNKAAVFPLQLLGFEVDVVNSVHFSNHTGYPGGVEGDVLNGDQLRAVLAGLERNDLLGDIGHLLTGYVGSESFLRAIINVLETLRKCGRQVRYVCDPVLGDAGKFYVPPSLVEVYKTEVIPLADVLTPNQFEVEQLTGIQIRTVEDALMACADLHDLGPEVVVITSIVEEGRIEDDDKSRTISIVASRRSRQGGPMDGTGDRIEPSDDGVWCIESPLVKGVFTGTGDLCAALLLAWTAIEPDNFPSCLEKVIGTMSAVIKRTSELGSDSVASRELKLIQSKIDIENPPVRYKARRVI